MIKLKDLLALMSYADVNFSENDFIQILDYEYGSHYRLELADGKLRVGGDFLPGRETDPDKLMEHQVTMIGVSSLNQIEIYVK